MVIDKQQNLIQIIHTRFFTSSII